jgi:hypothetical protein
MSRYANCPDGQVVAHKPPPPPPTHTHTHTHARARGSIDLTAEEVAKLPKLTTRVKEVTIDNAPPELHAQAESEFSPLRDNLARLEAQVRACQICTARLASRSQTSGVQELYSQTS